MTWKDVLTALLPSVQSAIYALVALLLGSGGTLYATSGKKEPEPPQAPQVQVTRPMQDQTKLQLAGIQGTLDEIRDLALDVRRELQGRKK